MSYQGIRITKEDWVKYSQQMKLMPRVHQFQSRLNRYTANLPWLHWVRHQGLQDLATLLQIHSHEPINIPRARPHLSPIYE